MTSYFSVLAYVYRVGMLIPEITVIPFTRALPYVQCTTSRLTCENYIADYKIFHEHQLNCRTFPVFPGAISNSKRFPGFLGVPGVVETVPTWPAYVASLLAGSRCTC